MLYVFLHCSVPYPNSFFNQISVKDSSDVLKHALTSYKENSVSTELVNACFVVACWERVQLLALLCVMFSCVFVTFSYGFLGQVWYLIVSNPDLCIRRYLYSDQGLHLFLN